MSSDIQFNIECISSDVTMMLMEDYSWDTRKAIDTFLSSNVYRKLENPATGLYFQSPAYIYEMLTDELKEQNITSGS